MLAQLITEILLAFSSCPAFASSSCCSFQALPSCTGGALHWFFLIDFELNFNDLFWFLALLALVPPGILSRSLKCLSVLSSVPLFACPVQNDCVLSRPVLCPARKGSFHGHLTHKKNTSTDRSLSLQVFRIRTPTEAINLVSLLLEYTPSARITPLKACAHPFFDELRLEGNHTLPNGREMPPLFNFTEHGKFWVYLPPPLAL